MCGAARQWYQGRVSSRAARASVMMSAMCGYNIHRVLIHYAVHIITLYTVHSVMMRNDCTYAVYSICTVKSLRCVQRNDVWHTLHQTNVIATAHVTLRRSDRCYRNGVIATDQTNVIATAHVTLHRSDRTGCDGTDLTAHRSRDRHGEIGLTGGTDSDRGRNRVC